MAFDKMVNRFLDELQKILPEERDLQIFRCQLDMVRMASPNKVINSFREYVLPHKAEVFAKNEKFFLEMSPDDYMAESIHMKSLWENKLSPANKEIVWQYFQAMVKLADADKRK